MKHRALVSVLLSSVAVLLGQVSTGSITGLVTDTSGAVVPNAAVRITNESTNVARGLVTDSAGLYSAPNLLPGVYRVEVTVPGFQPQTKAGLVLTIGQTLASNFAVQPGEQKQSVQVVARAEQLLQTA